MPAAAMTSASPSFAQVMPIAPAAISSLAIEGILCPFACGRQATPCVRHVSATAWIFASIRATSTHKAGVSSSAFVHSSRPAGGETDCVVVLTRQTLC